MVCSSCPWPVAVASLPYGPTPKLREAGNWERVKDWSRSLMEGMSVANPKARESSSGERKATEIERGGGRKIPP